MDKKQDHIDKHSSCEKPVFCDLVITENCMLRCKMCKMWQGKDNGSGLPVEIWKRFIDSFADFVGDKAQVQFVGGEPLLKEGILELIVHTAKKGFLTTMTTNGYLIDEKMARNIVASGLSTLVLSLDSIKRQTHDFLRGVEGTYDRLRRAISLLERIKNNSLKLHIVATIMEPNLDEILELTEWVNMNEAIEYISFQAVMQPFFTPFDESWFEKGEFSLLWPKDSVRVERILDNLIAFKEKGYKITNPVSQFKIFKTYFSNPKQFVKIKCNLGYNSITVDTAGRIFLCNSMEPIGNIRNDRNIEEIWLLEKTEEIREKIRNCKYNCKLMINCFFEEESTSCTEV